MVSPAKVLIDEILSMKKMSLRKLASVIKVRPSTLSRITTGYTETGTLATYMKLLQYKSNVMKTMQLNGGGV